MERALATIRRIDNIEPIENADMIEVATVGGWKVVITKKDNFKINDLCVYFEIDSLLPECELFEFLRESKFRIKTKKLRGVVSQGICFPLQILSKFGYMKYEDDQLIVVDKNDIIYYIIEDLDVTQLIGVIKYEPSVHVSLSGLVRGGFPGQVPKTDAERIQNLVRNFEQWKELDYIWTLTEKLDGTSVTFIMNEGEFHVCSRNLDLKETEDNVYWQIAKKYNIQEIMSKYNINFAIQGEIVGPGIQKNKYELKEKEVYFFGAFYIDEQKYFNNSLFLEFLYTNDLQGVPQIATDILLNQYSVEDLIKLVEGKSKLNNKIEREGIVFKSYSSDRNFGEICFKVINNKFLLKYED